MSGTGVKIIYLGQTGDTLCPLLALLAYLAIWPPTTGPFFLLKSGQALSGGGPVSAVRLALGSTALDISRFNGHSFHIGAATTAVEVGIPDCTIKLLGRWNLFALPVTYVSLYIVLQPSPVASSGHDPLSPPPGLVCQL